MLRRQLALALVATVAVRIAPLAAQIAYPPSDRTPVVDTLRDTTIVDPYRWLEDQEAPATRAWIDAQNAFRERVMAGLPGGDEISQRLGQRP